MGKAILVLDEMPEKCEDCRFYHYQINRLNAGKNYTATQKMEFCRIENPSKPIARYLEKTKPDWCPLKEMPDKLSMDDYDEHIPEDIENLLRYYNDGFNDCLSQILGEED